MHCYTLEAELDGWVDELDENVAFERLPAIGSDTWRLLGRCYFAMEKLGILQDNHLATFRAIHDKRMQLTSPERFADFIDGKGTTRADFLDAYSSPEVVRKMKQADSLQRRFRVASTPTLIVNGKYRVMTSRSVGVSRVLDVVEHLLDKDRKELTSKPAT